MTRSPRSELASVNACSLRSRHHTCGTADFRIGARKGSSNDQTDGDGRDRGVDDAGDDGATEGPDCLAGDTVEHHHHTRTAVGEGGEPRRHTALLDGAETAGDSGERHSLPPGLTDPADDRTQDDHVEPAEDETHHRRRPSDDQEHPDRR